MHARVLSRFSSVQLFTALWTVAHRLLCPWDSPDKNTGVGCHSLPQGLFLTQESNPHHTSLTSPVLFGGFFTTSVTWEAP